MQEQRKALVRLIIEIKCAINMSDLAKIIIIYDLCESFLRVKNTIN